MKYKNTYNRKYKLKSLLL